MYQTPTPPHISHTSGNTCNKSHLPWVDIAKGIGIILVVLAHSIFPFVQQVNYFHMSMFFIIAGITYHQKSLLNFLVSKINRIYIPWVFWSVVSSIVSLLPHGYGGVFNGPLWFLQDIFVALIIVYLVSLTKKNWQLFIVFLIMIPVSYIIINNNTLRTVMPFGIPLALISAQFIIIGNFLFRLGLFNIYLKRINISLCSLALVLFVGICHFLTVNGVEGNYVSLKLFRSNFAASYFACITGSLFVIFISILLRNNKYLEWLGRNSLVIMCVHFPFCMFLDGYLVKLQFFSTQLNKLILACSEWIFVIGISCAICFLCKRFIPCLTGYKSLLKI